MPISADEIEIRSEEVQDILTTIPNWVVRWGMTVIFISVAAIVVASFFIKYPDTIDSRIVLTTEVPPARIVARSSGNVEFRVEDKEMVSENALLGVIENPAVTEDVLALEQQLAPFHAAWQRDTIKVNPTRWDNNWQLGDLQSSFLAFRNAILNYHRFQDLDFYSQQINALESRVSSYHRLNRQLTRQVEIYKQEVALTRKQFQVDSLLYAKQSLPERDYNQSRNQLLQTERSYQASANQIINNEITVAQLEAQMGELRLQAAKEVDELRASIEESLQKLESQLSAWKQQFLLQSPIAGQVNFADIWSDNQFVNANTTVLTIIPDTSKVEAGSLVGQVLSPLRNSGKLEVGQRVNIRFDNFPANEYGMVMGEVTNISLIPTEEFYNVQVKLTNGLQTTYKRQLEYRPEMSGSATIITEDLRLIDRIFNQFRALVDRTTE